MSAGIIRMLQTLIATKLHVPSPRREIVPRPALLKKLADWQDLRLIVLCAPAGFGKTTLAVSWLEQSAIPVSWLTLDERDNDLYRFVSYLIRALQRFDPAIGVLASKQLDALDSFDLDLVFSEIINDIESLKISGVLVLDDFHFITEPEILTCISFMLKNLPSGFCLTVLTRNEPNIAISRLRSALQVRELGIDDFRFSSSEVKSFFNDLKKFGLSQEEITIMGERTEGWVCGLQLLALSLDGNPQRTHFIERFSGCDRFVSDYLVDEVLAYQPEQVQELLLFSSIVDRFCADLCRELVDIEPEGGFQEFFENSNLFIEPLDNERKWYRFHHLFRDLLLVRFEKKPHKKCLEAYRKVYRWHWKNGFYEDALRYAIACENEEVVVRIIYDIGYSSNNWNADTMGIREWLVQLPDTLWQNSPELGILKAFANMNFGKLIEAERVAERLSGFLDSGRCDQERERVLQGRISALSAALTCHRHLDQKKVLDLTAHALKVLPEHCVADRCGALFHRALALIRVGELDEARSYLDWHYSNAQTLDSRFSDIISEVGRGYFHYEKGGLLMAELHYGNGYRLGCEHRMINTSPFTCLTAGLAQVYFERNELGEALHNVPDLDEMGRDDEYVDCVLIQHRTAIYIYCAARDFVSAWTVVSHSEKICQDEKVIRDKITYSRAYISFCEGDVGQVRNWADEVATELMEEAGREKESERLLLAAVWIDQQKLTQATVLLQQLEQIAQEQGRQGVLFQAQILRAKLLYQTGTQKQGLELLRTTLELTETEGFVQLYLFAGEPINEMILRLAESTKHTSAPSLDYLQRIIQGFMGSPLLVEKAATKEVRDLPVIPELVSLTPREREILLVLVKGFEYSEMARMLDISKNTLKYHVKNIYSKLNVENRMKAVYIARQLGLL